MGRFRRGTLSALLGALIGTILSATAFSVMAMLDGTRPTEAMAFGVVAGIIGGFFGLAIGFAVGVGNLGLIGGAIAGLLAAFAAVGFYVLVFGRAGQYGYFLRESVVVVLFLGLPAVLTGALTAAVMNRAGRAAGG